MPAPSPPINHGMRNGKATVPDDRVQEIRSRWKHRPRGYRLKMLHRDTGIALDTLRDWIYNRTRNTPSQTGSVNR